MWKLVKLVARLLSGFPRHHSQPERPAAKRVTYRPDGEWLRSAVPFIIFAFGIALLGIMWIMVPHRCQPISIGSTLILRECQPH